MATTPTTTPAATPYDPTKDPNSPQYKPVVAAQAQPGATPTQQQAAAASAYSPTPTAAPTASTTNQGTQDVYRNTLLGQATQNPSPDANDPIIRAQQDAFEAANERSRRNQIADSAEAANAQGLGNSGALTSQDRLINEQSAQNASAFTAQLMYNELNARRDQIQNALSQLGNNINSDQGRALQLQLAQIEEKLGYADLALRDKLGMAGVNFDYAQLGQQNQQFNKTLGFNIGATEAQLNNDALTQLMRG